MTNSLGKARHRGKGRNLKAILREIIPLAAASIALPCLAHASEREVTLNIARQPIIGALNELSQQTGLQVTYLNETPNAAIIVGPLSGRYGVDEAIRLLLAPGGLSFVRPNERVVTVLDSAPKLRSGLVRPTRYSLMRSAHRQTTRRPAAARSKAPGDSKAADNDRDWSDYEEVVVTAQKRSEKLQDVPISISALSGQDLDRSSVQGVTETLSSVSGFAATTSHNGMGAAVTVRGVPGGVLFSGASPIAYYIDSIPFGLVRSALAPDSSTYDLQRVEALRGPQGTLYGANALNGVIRVLTNEADTENLEVKLRTSGSSTKDGGENYRADMAVNVPIIEGKLAARVVAGYQDLSGWVDRATGRDANDSEIGNLRLKVNAQPTDELSIALSAWLSRSDQGAPSTSDRNGRHVSLLDEPNANDYDAYGVKLNYDFESVTLTSSTSYLKFSAMSILDYVPYCCQTTQDTFLDSTVFAQELLLSSTASGPWRWSLGGFFRDAEDETVYIFPGFGPTPAGFDDASKSTAFFGEVTRAFFDGRVELTGGLRYFEDDVRTRDNAPGGTLRQDGSFDAVSPRVVLTLHPSDHLMVYSSYSEGFRSGVFQVPDVAVVGIPPAEPDTLKNYEIGTKGDLWGGALTFDIAAYYIDWQDVQQNVGVLVNGIGYASIVNGDSASGPGVDFAVTARPLEGMSLGVTASWNDLTTDSDVVSNGLVLVDKGDRLDLSPEWTMGLSAAHVFPLGSAGFAGRISASANRTTRTTLRTAASATGRIIGTSDVQTIARASFAVAAPADWEVTLFMDNLTNEQGATLRTPYDIPSWEARPRPRAIGLQLDYSFR